MSQCKLPVKFEGDPKRITYCIKDLGHEGPHELGKIPLSLQISCSIKELLWYRWIPIRKIHFYTGVKHE